MKADRIGQLLRDAYTDTPECPLPQDFLELDGVAPEERERLLQHADTCPRCAAELELARAFADAPAGSEPGTDVADIVSRLERARFDRPAPEPGRWSVRSWGLAAAAMLALTVVGVVLIDRGGAPPLPPPGSDSATRGNRVEITGPVGELEGLPGTLEWESSPNAARYRVRLLRVDDSILLETTVKETRFDLPEQTLNEMHRAVVYFWQVEALDEHGGRVAVSERVRFRAAAE